MHSNRRPGQHLFFLGDAVAASNRVYKPTGLHTSRGRKSGAMDTGGPPLLAQHVHCLCSASVCGSNSKHMNGAVAVTRSGPRLAAAHAAVGLRPQDKNEKVFLTPSQVDGSKVTVSHANACMVLPSLAQRISVSALTQSPPPTNRTTVDQHVMQVIKYATTDSYLL